MISITIVNAGVSDNNISLVIDTTHSDKPGDVRRMAMQFDVTKPIMTIKGEIDAAAMLLWTALANQTWTLP